MLTTFILICFAVAGTNQQRISPTTSCLTGQRVHNQNSGNERVSNKDLSNALLKYTMKLYQKMATSSEFNDKNLFTSPYSLWTALTMMYLGARGDTSDVLGKLLNLENLNKDKVKRALFKFQKELSGKEDVFNVANLLAFDQRVVLKSCVKNIPLLDISSNDFYRNPGQALAQINRYVSSKTNGKIPQVLSDDSVTSDTLMVLLNAVYFKGTWKYNFNPLDTVKDFFIVSPLEVREIQMMKIQTLFGYYHSMAYNFSAVELPYTGDKYSMILIIPDDRETNINQFIAQMIPEDITGILTGLRERSMTLHVPKIEIDAEFNLNGLLTDMGAGGIFQGAALDGFVKSSPPMRIGDVIQKSYLKVNEKGTEAAASSAIVTQTRTGGKFGHIVLKFNRPHVFIIRDIDNNVPLFMGVIRKPQGTTYKKS